MTRLLKTAASAIVWIVALNSGCAPLQQEQAPATVAPAITCIGVLPAGTVIDYDGNLSYTQAKNLKQGTEVMNKMLVRQLQPRSDVRFVTEDKLQGLSELLPNDPLALARLAGKHLSCNAVLETTVYNYSERVGGEYSAKEPAAVSFKYRLIELEKGGVLCKGEFRETQQSVMENLLEFGKAKERGFTWITAEELMQEGLGELFGKCSYLDNEK